MDTKALRQKILDLAIRGKLVPQDSNDEPASVLLERIRAEKQQMVKDGKLKPKDIKNDTVIFKGDDNLHYEQFADGTVKCIEDEIPFDVPNNWEWVRIKTACVINPRNNIDDDTEVSFVPMANIEEGYANKFISDVRVWKKIKTGYTHFAENDIGVAKITPCFENKKSVVFNGLINGYGAGTTELYIVRAISGLVIPEYLLNFFKRDDFIAGGVLTFSGDVGQQRVTKDYVANYLFTLPPLNEQQRILNAVHNVNSLIESIENSKDNLKVDINRIKAKILDLAIRGKLVPQDPNDEPASVLLERIRAEKEELIKQGKIKRDKKESVIFKGDDNSYYQDLPYNWQISTLREITTPLTLNDGDWILSENMTDNGEVKLLQLGSIGNMSYIDKGFKYLTKDTFDELSCTEIFTGYLIINRIISDKMCCCVVPDIDGTIITTVDTCWIAPSETSYDIKFLMYQLASPYFQNAVLLKATGTTRKRISKNNLIDLHLLLPPLAEQKRIVVAIETLFAQIDKIVEQIS